MLTRAEIEKMYKVENGIIKSPGKFEQEPVYVPYYWDLVLDGGPDEQVDDEDGTVHAIFEIDMTDVEMWPELGITRKLDLWEDSQGFVRHTAIEWNINERE